MENDTEYFHKRGWDNTKHFTLDNSPSYIGVDYTGDNRSISGAAFKLYAVKAFSEKGNPSDNKKINIKNYKNEPGFYVDWTDFFNKLY